MTTAPPFPGTRAAASANCGACGTALAGVYCHACGQPGPAARQRASEALLGQSGRLLHTLRILLTRPGELARETDECRDRGSIRPLTLLLNVVAFFFLLSGLTDFRLQAFERQDETGKLTPVLGQALLKGLRIIGVGLVADSAVFIAALNLALRTV